MLGWFLVGKCGRFVGLVWDLGVGWGDFLETITGLGFARGWSIWVLGCVKGCGKVGKAVDFARGWGCGKGGEGGEGSGDCRGGGLRGGFGSGSGANNMENKRLFCSQCLKKLPMGLVKKA